MYARVVTWFTNGTKRSVYMQWEFVARHVDDRLAMGGFKRLVIETVSEAQYVRHTSSE